MQVATGPAARGELEMAEVEQLKQDQRLFRWSRHRRKLQRLGQDMRATERLASL
jgi:hypothetical protein